MLGRIRRLVAGEVEDADVDRRHGDERLVAGGEAGERQRHGQRTARAHFRRGVEGDGERALLATDAEPGKAEGAGRHAAGGDVHRPVKSGRDVGAGRPVVADGERHGEAFGGHLDGLHLDEAVADHRDQRDAGELRGEAQVGGVAGGVAGLVERELQEVRRLGGGADGRPAGGEVDAGGGLRLGLGDHLEAVAAPVGRCGHAGGLAGGKLQRAPADATRRGDRLERPAAVAVVPLVAPLDLEELPLDAIERRAGAGGIDRDDLEGGGLALADTVVGEQRLDADAGARGRHRQRQRALDGAAAGLADPQEDLGRQRLRRRLELGQAHRHLGLAVGTGARQLQQRPAQRRRRVVEEAEAVAGIALDLGGRADDDVALEREVGGRGAVEELSIDGEHGRIVRSDRWRVGREGELDALGHEVLDEEGGAADRRRLRVGIGVEAPGAGHRRGDEIDRQRAATETAVGGGGAGILDAVRARHHQRQRQRGDGIGTGVAQQRGGVNGLAGPVDAALGVNEGVERARRGAAVDAAIGEVEARGGEVEEGVVAVAHRGGEDGRRHAATPGGEAGGEDNVAGRVGRGGAEDFVVAGDEAHLGSRDGLGGREGADEGVDAIGAGEAREAEIGDDEPLRRAGVAGPARLLLRPGCEHVDAGLQRLHGLVDGEGGGDLLVQHPLDRHRAGPDESAVRARELVDLVGLQLAAEAAVGHRAGERPVADAQKVEDHVGSVDADHRHAGGTGARQHVGG